jgi:hypothetical protein
VIRQDLLAGGGADILVAERVRDVHLDLAQLAEDDRLFHHALKQLGPLLGARASASP